MKGNEIGSKRKLLIWIAAMEAHVLMWNTWHFSPLAYEGQARFIPVELHDSVCAGDCILGYDNISEC